MKDFLGQKDVQPETGLPSLANVEALGWFTDLFRADYELMGAAVESVDELLEIYLYAREYSHKEYHPIGNFISGILDVTIIKPFIESIYGKDLITGEKLTDFERGMQLVNAVVGAVTLGQGALALDFTKMAGKEIAVELLKIWGVDAISDMAAFTVGYTCDELGMPAGVSFIASLLTGCTVSTGISGYVFTDAGGNVVKELDVDEMQAWLKEMDVDLDGLVGGGKKNTESWVDLMSPEDAAKYNYWVDLREAGLDQVKINEIILTNKGYRPDPTTYLSQEYIEAHLELFSDGVVKISAITPTVQAGPPGGTFVMPKSVADDIIQEANGSVLKLEQLLSLEPGSLGDNPVRIDIAEPQGLRMPSGNELGANEQWIPGGKTGGGIPEATIDSPLQGEFVTMPIFE